MKSYQYYLCDLMNEWIMQLPEELHLLALDAFRRYHDKYSGRWHSLFDDKKGIDKFVMDEAKYMQEEMNATGCPYITFERYIKTRVKEKKL